MRGTDQTTARARKAAATVAVLAALGVCTAPVAASPTTAPPLHAADVAAQASASAAARSAAARHAPNIVLITTDDQSVDDLAVMSKVRARLAHRGTTFANAFSPYPLCCPARATILTGQYAHNHHVLGNKPPYGGFAAFDDDDTLSQWLQAAGYRTAVIGKYLNQYPADDDPLYIPPGWDDWRVPVDGVYNYRRFTVNDNGREVRHRGEYQTSYVSDEAVDIVDRYAPGKAPFFLWAGFLAPHEGGPREPDDPRLRHQGSPLRTPTVQKRYRDSLEHLRLPRKRSINEDDVSDKPHYIRSEDKLPVRALEELLQQRRESLRSVDDAVARILRALKAHGELRNTVVVFTSDNGFLVGEHRRTGKVVGYEESARVPMIVAGPGFNTGRTRDTLVSLADLAPTIADVAGAVPGRVQDGTSLGRIAHGRSPGRALLLEAGPDRGNLDRWYTGIRTKRYVYVDYNTGERELYDLRRDPLQLRNLAGRSSHQVVEGRLRTALAALEDCTGADCRLPSSKLFTP